MRFKNEKVRGERAATRHKDMTESNHIITLLSPTKEEQSYHYTKIEALFPRTASSAVIVFEFMGQTWWCNQQEFETFKFVLEHTTNYAIGWYLNYGATMIDGTKLMLEFN